MKFWATIITLTSLAGTWWYVELTMQIDDEKRVKEFIESRGMGPVPRSWRGEVGKGI